jgi:hypothetical protein
MAVSRTRSSTRTTTPPDPGSGCIPRPGPGRRSASRESPANGPSSRADIVLHHMPASTCRGPLARCPGKTPGTDLVAEAWQRRARAQPAELAAGPITVSAALNTSRCRTQAKSAGRTDRRLMAEPRRKRRHAKLRKANRTSGSACRPESQAGQSAAYRSAVILSPFGISPGRAGVLRVRHVADVRLWARLRTQKRGDKGMDAGHVG